MPGIGEVSGTFGAAAVLAFMVEALLEYILGIWWKPMSGETRARLVMAAGLVLGIGLALAYRVDFLAELGLQPSIVGQIISGAIIGRGADYLHAFWKRLKG